jgi:phage-related protein
MLIFIGRDMLNYGFKDNRIARVLFVIVNKTMILLHGFIKKDQKTPKPELDLAKQRLKTLRGKR